MTCPTCNGNKVENILIRGQERTIQCSRCYGVGQVSDEMAQWVIDGKKMRQDRVYGQPYRSLVEEAKRRGLDTVILSQMEMGKIKPITHTEEL